MQYKCKIDGFIPSKPCGVQRKKICLVGYTRIGENKGVPHRSMYV